MVSKELRCLYKRRRHPWDGWEVVVPTLPCFLRVMVEDGCVLLIEIPVFSGYCVTPAGLNVAAPFIHDGGRSALIEPCCFPCTERMPKCTAFYTVHKKCPAPNYLVSPQQEREDEVARTEF